MTENKSCELTWSQAEEILTHICDPVFPDYQVNIMSFGAAADGATLDTEAFADAIRHVSGQGGGTVVVPKGTYLTGSIELLSNVNLHLEDVETRLCFTTEINEINYPVVYSHWESSPLYNYRPLIYSFEARNIALTGRGTLDGQASAAVWWNWKHQIEHTWSESKVNLQEKASNMLRDMNDNGVPVEDRIFGDGYYLRPNFIQTIRSENVLLEGVTLNNSPMWQVNPVLCTNVTIRGMTLRSHGANNDGVDPESCNYILVENNVFDSGDDCIAIKSGRDRDGRTLNIPTQNMIIRSNTFADGHGGIALGSEMSGGIRNVFADDNQFDSPNLTYALRFKTNARRGGTIENVYLRNSEIRTVNQATIHATMMYAEGRDGSYIPQFKNIVIEQVKGNGGEYGIFMDAFEEVPITGLVLRNVEITNVKTPLRALNWGKDTIMENVRINGELYPRPTQARILGVPIPGERLTAAALLIGGDPQSLAYDWLMGEQAEGPYVKVEEGQEFMVPAGSQGRFIKLRATDANQAATVSMPYLILERLLLKQQTADHSLAAAATRLASKGIIGTGADLALEEPVTRLAVARMISAMWGLTEPRKPVAMADVEPLHPEYKRIAAVIEAGMMALQQGSFHPAGTLTREEMSSVAVMCCGVSFKNFSTIYDSTFSDGEEIQDIYLSNVERANYFGLLKGTAPGIFNPRKLVTVAETLDIMAKVSDFAGK